MSHRILQVTDHPLVIYDMSGAVTIADLEACRAFAVGRGPTFTTQNHLLLFQERARVEFQPAELRSFTLQSSGRKTGSIRVVVAEGDLNFGMARMLDALRPGTGDGVTVTRSMARACEELGVPREAVERALLGESAEVLASAER